MANSNEFLITDIVGQKAFDDLSKLQVELRETTTLYAAFATEIANASKQNPKTFDELTAKANGFTASLAKLNGAGEQMAGIQRQQLAVLKQVSAQLNNTSGLSKLTALMDQFTKNAQAASEALARVAANASASGASQQQAAQGAQQAAQAMAQAQQALNAQAKSYDELASEIDAVMGSRMQNIRRMIEEQDAIRSLNKQIKDLTKYQSQGTSMSAQQRSRLEQLNALLLQHKTALSEIRQNLNNSFKLNNAAATSMNGMAQSLGRMRMAYRELTEEERNSPFGKELLASIQQADAKLKKLDATLGNYQRNVGNYASHWNGLGMSIQQIGRELPSLAMGWNTFFLAISNNLPILTDELARAKREYRDLTAQGQKAVPVWRQVVSSIFSWQTALTVGITLLSVYGKEIMEWIGSLFDGNEANRKLAESQKELNTAWKEGERNAQGELTRLRLMYNATQDVSRSMDERRKAVDELQKQYPSYFGNMSNEDMLAGNAADSYARLTQSIIASAKAKVAMEKITDQQKIVLENEGKIADAYARIERLQANLVDINSKLDGNTLLTPSMKGELAARSGVIKNTIESIEEEIEGYRNAIYYANKLSQELQNSISINDILFGSNEGGTGNGGEDAAEEYAAYIKKITEDLNKSRIELMEEGRMKEMAEIRADYDARMAEITGQTQEEIELRQNLEALKQKALKEVDEKYAKEMLEMGQEDLENRLAAIAGNSQRELDERLRLQLELNGMMRDAELAEARRSGADTAAIISKYEKEKNDIVMRNLEERFGLIQGATDAEVRELELAALKERNALKEQYAEGTISREEYEEGLNGITVKFSKQRLQAMMEEARQQLALANLTDEQRKDLEMRLEELQAKLDALGTSEGAGDASEKAREMEEALRLMERQMSDSLGESSDLLMGVIDLFKELTREGEKSAVAIVASVMRISNGLASLMSDIYQARIDALDEEQEANEEAYDKEVERIEALQERGAISTEEAEARKRAAEDKTKQKEQQIARQKAQLEEKQARWDKANSIIQATIATALAVTKVLPNFILAAVVAAMGAAQIAIISAQQVPKYAKGTKDHPGGLAIVGDGGRPEGIVTERGVYVSPGKPTLVNLPRHARVIPDLSAITSTDGLRSDFGLLEKQLKERREAGVTVNVDNDFSPLERGMRENTRELKDIRRLMRKQGVRGDFGWMYGRV